MEYYFEQPSTKFYWDDFKKKALVKDQGNELRRKMIVKNIHATTKLEFIELKHVCLHMNALIRAKKIENNSFRNLLEFFSELKAYLQEYFIYRKIKSQISLSKI